MTILRKRFGSVAVLLMLILLMSGVNVNAASTKVKLKSYNSPTSITQGDSYSIKGKISSNKKLKRVEIGIVSSSNNKWTRYKYDKRFIKTTKSFNVKKADNKLKFGKLEPGTYYYRIYAHVKGKKKAKLLLNKKFVVAARPEEDDNSMPANATECTDGSVKLSGANAPSDYNVGKNFTPKGMIVSEDKMSRVEIGIVFEPTNKWTPYKYDATISSTTFDIGRAATSLSFDKLPGGTYFYRIYAHTPGGVKIVANRKFTVKPSVRPQAAVNWATNIANDDSFTYGKKPETSKLGCYFCGTNQKKKPKGYEKTYVCLTFVGAAYAHGAGDPELLYACQNAKMILYENDNNFKKFSCWMKIGACKDLTIEDLQVGDVVIDWSADNDNTGHVWIYAGGDNLVDSEGYGWQAKSIAVRSGAAKKLKGYASDKRNYVMRYNR